jgi:hypothetical protein
LVPSDGDFERQESLLSVAELQAACDAGAARRRMMFLDCCQVPVAWPTAGQGGEAGNESMGTAKGEEKGARNPVWRSGLPMLGEFVAQLRLTAKDWSILMSCSPGECSLEEPADSTFAHHGVFAYCLALGLRGEADSNGDGVVSFAELAEYVCRRVPGRARAAIQTLGAEPRGGGPGVCSQNPLVVSGRPMAWQGNEMTPITKALARSDVRVGQRQGGPDREFWRLWSRWIFGAWAYRMAGLGLFRFGLGTVYGAIMVCLMVSAIPESEGRTFWWLMGLFGVGSGLVWCMLVAMSAAAGRRHWHAGGYVPSALLAIWHVVIFGLFHVWQVSAGGGGAWGAPETQLGAALFLLWLAMMVFGFNALQGIVSLHELVRTGEYVAVRQAFLELESDKCFAQVPNCVAMVSLHPWVYVLLGVGVSGILILNGAVGFWTLASGGQAAASLTMSALVMVQVLTLTFWYQAAYHSVRGIHDTRL